METTIVYRVYNWMMDKKTETTVAYWDYIMEPSIRSAVSSPSPPSNPLRPPSNLAQHPAALQPSPCAWLEGSCQKNGLAGNGWSCLGSPPTTLKQGSYRSYQTLQALGVVRCRICATNLFPYETPALSHKAYE